MDFETDPKTTFLWNLSQKVFTIESKNRSHSATQREEAFGRFHSDPKPKGEEKISRRMVRPNERSVADVQESAAAGV